MSLIKNVCLPPQWRHSYRKNSLSTLRANHISKMVDPFEKGLICQGRNLFPAGRLALEKKEKNNQSLEGVSISLKLSQNDIKSVSLYSKSTDDMLHD